MEDNRERNAVFSRRLKAGRRTYFFDVKSTRSKDYYIALTESTKKYRSDGTYGYEKHKIFLYREDFDRFTEVLQEAIEFVKSDLTPNIDLERLESSEEYNEYLSISENGEDDQLKWE
ncbi:MAG: PUR family DNA/RNA-binding protein [Microscillaceae bacterium]|nr:PUR family DNA/RNA-binding protein [Microscillaceae bacterium]